VTSLLVLGLSAGCSGDTEVADPPVTTETEASTSTTEVTTSTAPEPPADDGAAALAAYEGFWAAFVEILSQPDPELLGALAEYGGGQALDAVEAVIQQYHAEGVRARGDYELHPQLVHLDETSAVLEDCIVDNLGKYLVVTDEVIEPAEGKGVGFRAGLEREGDRWRVLTLEAADEVCSG